MKNRIKERQLHLFTDRPSAVTLRDTRIRIVFVSSAYILLESLRRLSLTGADMARAQC